MPASGKSLAAIDAGLKLKKATHLALSKNRQPALMRALIGRIRLRGVDGAMPSRKRVQARIISDGKNPVGDLLARSSTGQEPGFTRSHSLFYKYYQCPIDNEICFIYI